MLAQHSYMQADMTVACCMVPPEEASQFGVMTVEDDQRIIDFHEKPEKPAQRPGDSGSSLVSMGIYIFSYGYLEEQLQRDALDENSKHDFGMDIIPYTVANNHRVFAYPFEQQVVDRQAYWRDVGTIDAYFEANMEVLKPEPALDLYGTDWRIRTYQEQLPPAKFVSFGNNGSSLGTSMVSGGCVIHQSSLDNSLLFSNVQVGKNCRLKDVLALPDSVIGNNVHLNRVLLDNGCHVPDGAVIGEDPEEDARRYYRTSGGIVVVNREMLGQEREYVPVGEHALAGE